MNEKLLNQLVDSINDIVDTVEGTTAEKAQIIREFFENRGNQSIMNLEEFWSWFDDQ